MGGFWDIDDDRRLGRTFVAGTADLDRSSLGSPWY